MASSTTPFVHAVQEEFGSASDLGVSAARLRQSPSGGGAGPGASGAAFPGVTQLAAPFTQQLAGITTDASVRSTQGIVVGQQVFVPGLYDLRQMTMGIMGQIAGSFTANMLDGAPVDARESDLASATFALTGPFLLDLRGATYSQTNLIGGAGPGVTVDRNVIALPPVTVAASPAAPIAVLITPPLPVALYSVPQPELTSGPGGFLQITGKTGAQFLVASTGGAGVYNALVLRRP